MSQASHGSDQRQSARPYEIIAALGQGGMGVVFRARDTRLDRDVAIKILPDEFAADPERLARFDREVKTLASLNHPRIAHGGTTPSIEPRVGSIEGDGADVSLEAGARSRAVCTRQAICLRVRQRRRIQVGGTPI